VYGCCILVYWESLDTTLHLGLLYKLSTLQFLNSLIKLIGSFLSQKNFRVSVEGEMSAPRDIQAGVPQGSIIAPTLYSTHKWYSPNTCVYATDCKEDYVLRKLQRGLSAIETWCERWNIKINEDNTQAIYFSHRLRPHEVHLTLNGQNIPFVNHTIYLGVTFNKRITWKLHVGMIEAKAFRTFIRIYSLFKSEGLSANNKLTLHKALIRSVMTQTCPAWEISGRHLCLKTALHAKQFLRTIRNFPRCTPVHD
jgi:hypothetical protein